jgi:hypothetical protein
MIVLRLELHSGWNLNRQMQSRASSLYTAHARLWNVISRFSRAVRPERISLVTPKGCANCVIGLCYNLCATKQKLRSLCNVQNLLYILGRWAGVILLRPNGQSRNAPEHVSCTSRPMVTIAAALCLSSQRKTSGWV